MRRLFCIAGLLAVGAIFGPLISAAISTAEPASGKWAQMSAEQLRMTEIGMLMEALDTRKKQSNQIVRYSVTPPPDGKECGYDPDRIFPDKYNHMLKSRTEHSYDDYLGYWALDRWRSDLIDRAIDAEIASRMKMDRFEAGFLRRCIQQTMFSGVCADQVEKLEQAAYEGVDRRAAKSRQDFLLFGAEDNVVCTFVDGVAARKGLPLSKPFDQKYADQNGSPY